MFIFKRKTSYEKEISNWEKKYSDPTLRDYNPQCLIDLANINFKYGKIDEYEKDKRCIEAISKDWTIEKKEEELLKNKLKHKKIDELEFEKKLNDIKKNPWAKVHFIYNQEEDPSNIQTEIVYNEYFIKHLMKLGYSGNNESDLINSWLSQIFVSNIDDSDILLNNENTYNKIDNSTFIIG